MVKRDKKFMDFLEENKDLFWHFDKSRLDELSDDVIVEYILNYGDEKSVTRLFEIMGLEYVAGIFKKNTAEDRRINYFPRTKHFFELYFSKYVQGYSKRKSA